MAKKVQKTTESANTEKKVYVCSNGAEYIQKEAAEKYQKILDPEKEVEEKEIP